MQKIGQSQDAVVMICEVDGDTSSHEGFNQPEFSGIQPPATIKGMSEEVEEGTEELTLGSKEFGSR